MLNVYKDQLVVEEKGIYSIEHFLNARRLMYWQVYLHKTSVSAERMLVNIIKRAQALVRAGERVPSSQGLQLFLKENFTIENFQQNRKALLAFGQLLEGAESLVRQALEVILSDDAEERADFMRAHDKLFQMLEAAKGSIH